MAHHFYNRVDAQYGRPVLDQKSGKTLESFRIKPSQEDGGNYRETGISWKYCPTEKNLADLGRRGAGIHKMETGGWFTGPEWLLDEKQRPDQPDF